MKVIAKKFSRPNQSPVDMWTEGPYDELAPRFPSHLGESVGFGHMMAPSFDGTMEKHTYAKYGNFWTDTEIVQLVDN